MAGWIIPIAGKFPQHWDIAVEDGFWDLRTPRGIQTGDNIYFWLTDNNGFIGWAEALSDATHIEPSMPQSHWADRDTTPYRSRFRLRRRGETVPAHIWGDIQRDTGIKQGIRGPVKVADPGVEAHLQSLFETVPDELAAVEPYEHREDDLRKRTLRELKTRQGQKAFRNSLLAAYDHACAITGCRIESVLEAAHIDSYRGECTNRIQNGLLLRADMHTLFDLHLLTVDDDLAVRIAPRLRGSEYEALEGRKLALPKRCDVHPDPGALQRHRTEFEDKHGRG